MTTPKTPTTKPATKAKTPAKPATKAKTVTPPAPAMFSAMLMPETVEELPMPVNPYFVIARRRNYVHKNMHFGRVLVPFDGELPTLHDLDEKWKAFLWQDIPAIPAQLVGEAWSFFRAIWNKNKSEAMLDLYYNPTTKEYRFFVPPQIASGGGVRCVRNPEHIQTGWRHVGTMHSHCNFGAYHSGTDKHDADEHDGIHFTIGHVDKNPAQVAIMISANKILWDVDYTEAVDGELKLYPHPTWWERYVEHPIAKEHFRNTPSHVGGTQHPASQYGWNRGSTPSTPSTLWQRHQDATTLLEHLIEAEKIPAHHEGNEFIYLAEVLELIDDLASVKEAFAYNNIRLDIGYFYSPFIMNANNKNATPPPLRAKNKDKLKKDTKTKKQKKGKNKTDYSAPLSEDVKTSCQHSEPACSACYVAKTYTRITEYTYADGATSIIEERVGPATLPAVQQAQLPFGD